jgi:hypothetical protein
MLIVSGDELISNIIQVISDNSRLRADSQNIVANPLDQCRLPTGRHGAQCVPGMAGDKTKLGGFNPKLLLDIGVGLTRRLMVLHAVCAEAPLEEVDNATMFKLTRLNLKQVIREGEEPETRLAQLA